MCVPEPSPVRPIFIPGKSILSPPFLSLPYLFLSPPLPLFPSLSPSLSPPLSLSLSLSLSPVSPFLVLTFSCWLRTFAAKEALANRHVSAESRLLSEMLSTFASQRSVRRTRGRSMAQTTRTSSRTPDMSPWAILDGLASGRGTEVGKWAPEANRPICPISPHQPAPGHTRTLLFGQARCLTSLQPPSGVITPRRVAIIRHLVSRVETDMSKRAQRKRT